MNALLLNLARLPNSYTCVIGQPHAFFAPRVSSPNPIYVPQGPVSHRTPVGGLRFRAQAPATVKKLHPWVETAGLVVSQVSGTDKTYNSLTISGGGGSPAISYVSQFGGPRASASPLRKRVTPAQAGVQPSHQLDSRLRGNDGMLQCRRAPKTAWPDPPAFRRFARGRQVRGGCRPRE